MRDHFEELIKTIEKNAVDNKATITDVYLWAASWRAERDIDIEHELDRIKKKMKETPYKIMNSYYSPLQEFVTDDSPEINCVDNCAFSSTIGQKLSTCEERGCQLKNK